MTRDEVMGVDYAWTDGRIEGIAYDVKSWNLGRPREFVRIWEVCGEGSFLWGPYLLTDL